MLLFLSIQDESEEHLSTIFKANLAACEVSISGFESVWCPEAGINL